MVNLSPAKEPTPAPPPARMTAVPGRAPRVRPPEPPPAPELVVDPRAGYRRPALVTPGELRRPADAPKPRPWWRRVLGRP